VIIWARHWLAAPVVQPYGMLRMVRDVLHISGFLVFDAGGQIIELVLNQAAPLAPTLVTALRNLLAPTHIALNSSESNPRKR
jgi:hypothetical protein